MSDTVEDIPDRLSHGWLVRRFCPLLAEAVISGAGFD